MDPALLKIGARLSTGAFWHLARHLASKRKITIAEGADLLESTLSGGEVSPTTLALFAKPPKPPQLPLPLPSNPQPPSSAAAPRAATHDMSAIRRACWVKRIYLSQDIATAARDRIALAGGPALRPYQCPACRRWHLTSRNPKK